LGSPSLKCWPLFLNGKWINRILQKITIKRLISIYICQLIMMISGSHLVVEFHVKYCNIDYELATFPILLFSSNFGTNIIILFTFEFVRFKLNLHSWRQKKLDVLIQYWRQFCNSKSLYHFKWLNLSILISNLDFSNLKIAIWLWSLWF